MDLSGSDRTRTLPGLKHSNPYNKLWSLGQDDMAVLGRMSPTWDRPLSVPPPELQEPRPSSRESFGPIPDRPDPSTTPTPGQGCITIPRPHGRKTPEPSKVLAPPVPQSRSKQGSSGDGGTTAGGQEFRQALGMSPGGDLLMPARVSEEDVDLLSLLDPLSSPAHTTQALLGEGGDPTTVPPSSKPVLPPRPYPQSLPPFPSHPQMPLNPFAQTLHYPPVHRHYSPTVGGNPFSGAYGPPTGTYFHTPPHSHPAHPLSTLPGLYRHPSPVGSTLPPSLGPLRPAFPPAGPPPPSSSNHTLSSLLDSPSAPTPAHRVLPKPDNTEEESCESQDPFGDLLAMTKPTAPPKKRVEDLRRRWETFD